MPKSETRPSGALRLDLSPPVRLDLWAVALAAGIVAGTVVPPVAVAILVASALVAAGAAIWDDLVGRDWRLMAVLGPLFVAAGMAIAFQNAATPDPLAELAALEPGEVTVVGEVASPPVPGGYAYKTDLRVEHLWYRDTEVLRGGGIQVFSGDMGVGVGDRVRADGEIVSPEPGEDGFDYARYLSTKGISAVVYADGLWRVDDRLGWIGRVHRRTDVALGYGLRPQEASIVRAMVLGDRSRMPEELEEDFRKTGITHILAISGQHVAILAAMVYFVLRAFAVPLAVRVPSTLALIWLYIIVAGAPPSAVRAGVVAALVLLATLLRRQISPLHFMSVMLAAVLAYNPDLIYSTGFQLSVAAVFGILLLRKPLKSLLARSVFRTLSRPPDLLSNLLAISLGAQIATAPIIASTFGEVSVIGTLTNLVAVPLSGPILTLGLVGAVAGNLLPILAYPMNYVNGFLVTLVEWTAQAAAALPFAAVQTPGTTLPLIGVFYVGCIPAAISAGAFPKQRWPFWAGLMLLWAMLWLALVGLTSG
ncbi:MAG: ComEC/Rec2 family competence protein [Rubrobacteraceae bacterium]